MNELPSYYPLVEKIARKVNNSLPRNSIIELDDLRQSGMIGLMDAFDRYRGDKGASFATYAGIRIRGEIVSELRKYTWLPRSIFRRARETGCTEEVEEGRISSLDSVVELKGDVIEDTKTNVYGTVESTYRIYDLQKAIIELGDKHMYILVEHYYKDRLCEDIAAELGVSPSAISQMLRTIYSVLKNKLIGWKT